MWLLAMSSRVHRSRIACPLALIATLLNAVAPVLAYAEAPLLRSRAAQAHHHDGMPPHHAPRTPHCVYCLDFAAGAALAPAPPVVATPPRLEAPLVTPALVVAVARASLRLASSRAPPLAASV
jgi:hypothetical protein